MSKFYYISYFLLKLFEELYLNIFFSAFAEYIFRYAICIPNYTYTSMSYMHYALVNHMNEKCILKDGLKNIMLLILPTTICVYCLHIGLAIDQLY
jgi:hypothetical protein